MLINSNPILYSFQPTIEFINQDRLKMIISSLALGILLISATYWVYSYFWNDRQVKPESEESQKKDLSPIYDNIHLDKDLKSVENPITPTKKIDLNNAAENAISPLKLEQEIEIKQETQSIASESNLDQKNDALKQLIKNTPPNTPDVIHSLIALQTHVHGIFENVYLGNLRAYYSIDPKFVERYSMVDSETQMVSSFRLYDHRLSNPQARKLYSDYVAAARDGCSTLNIKHVISVTQFKPKASVPIDDWSHFQPGLTDLGISRTQISVDDDEFAWDTISPHFDVIFNEIDKARLNNEPILIHCVEGKSRAVTVLIAYLINRCSVTFDEALTFIQNIRPQAEPKPSLANALKDYQH